jgi:hypothetical protein
MASHLQTLLLLALVCCASACFPNFDADGRDRCATNDDCTGDRVCSRVEGSSLLGTCTPAAGDVVITPEECRPFDQDGDGSFTDARCGTNLDCDDTDDRRSPLALELCDGVDNDCDGEIDEGLRTACGGCGVLPTEVCNGVDDDCDGVVDDGVTNACGQCGDPLPEWCDGQDNNCDGAIDEGLDCACEDGQERGCPNLQEVDLDLCRQGRQDCEGGRWGACRNPTITTGAESCDLRDNDCDGDIDEDFDIERDPSNCGSCGQVCSTLYTASTACAVGTCELVCRPGYHDVDGRPETGCEYPCAPSGAETCGNGVDEDCDGVADNGCDAPRLAGTYAWVNLFGRAAEGQPPGLVTGVLTADGQTGTATVVDLVRYTTDDEDGLARFSRTSNRTVTVDRQGRITLAPSSPEDPLGGIYRGQITPDSYGSMAVLMEYDGDRQIASMAILVRVDSPATAEVDHTHIRGPYHALHFLPDRLLTARLNPGPISVSGWSLDATAPLGTGRDLFTLDGTAGLVPSVSQEHTLAYHVDDNRYARVERNQGGSGGQVAAHYGGPTDAAGGVAVLALAGDADGEPAPFEPGLVLLTERRETPSLEAVEGNWTFAGLQTRYLEDERKIQYNAVQQELEFAQPQAGEHLRIFRDVEGVREDVGTVTVGRSSTGEVTPELRVSLLSNDNLDRPRIELRGAVNVRRDTAVFWEIADLGDGLPVTSVFIAVRQAD